MLQPRTKLQKAILHQVGDKDYIRDIYEHGADAGYPGLTYYSDTVKFFQKHRAEIVQLVQDTAAAFGQGAVEFIKSFRCLNGSYNDASGEAEIARALYGRLERDDTQIPNALTWFAAEEVARELMEG